MHRKLRPPHIPKNTVGMINALEFSFTFSKWAESLKSPMSVQMIMNHFGVSRATAYRWKSAWEYFSDLEAA